MLSILILYYNSLNHCITEFFKAPYPLMLIPTLAIIWKTDEM